MVDNLLAQSGAPNPRDTREDAAAPRAEPAAMNVAGANPAQNWCRIGDAVVLLIWMCVTNFTIRYHEKWADEAQAWLIARDLDLRSIWFHELRYEGSPGLWHTILWVAQHVFHAGYGTIGYIGLAGATAGAALLIFKAPFPRYIRWPLAFTYFMVYQYAVIARPYTLLPLLAFAAAMLFKDIQHPERMTVVLILLANLSFHGTIIAGCIGLAYLIDAIKGWSALGDRVRGRYVFCVAAMAITFIFLFLILKPSPDVEDVVAKMHSAQMPKLSDTDEPSASWKLLVVLTGSFFDQPLVSGVFILLAGAWCLMRRRLLTFLLPIALLVALYVGVHGFAHNIGTVFVAAITGFWIAWPTSAEWKLLTPRQRLATQGMVVLLVCLSAHEMFDAGVVIRHEYLYPYSGADDATRYLKSVKADRGPIFGYLYGMVGVQAYFDHNILANVPTAYFHHGLPFTANHVDFYEMARVSPEYVVFCFGTTYPQKVLDEISPPMNTNGYELAHFSDGYMFNKRGVYERQVYFIFRRTHASASPQQMMLPRP
jgi:hypothetical protein